MYFYTQNQTLYPDFWDYTYFMVLEQLAKLVKKNGGRVEPHRFNTGYIENRTLYEQIAEKEKHFERFKRYFELEKEAGKLTDTEYNTKLENLTVNMTTEIETLKAVENKPVKTNYPGYIRFILDGFYYSFTYSESTFNYVCSKTPVRNDGTILDNIYSENVSRAFWDGISDNKLFQDKKAYKKAIKEAAEILLNSLKNNPVSGVYREQTRKRVSNTYNSGYHYETIYSKDKYKKIEF